MVVLQEFVLPKLEVVVHLGPRPAARSTMIGLEGDKEVAPTAVMASVFLCEP
jgi:hypothetical protein